MLHDRKTAQIVVNCSQEISTFKLKIKTLIHVHINGLFRVCSQFDRVIIKKSHGFIIIKKPQDGRKCAVSKSPLLTHRIYVICMLNLPPPWKRDHMQSTCVVFGRRNKLTRRLARTSREKSILANRFAVARLASIPFQQTRFCEQKVYSTWTDFLSKQEFSARGTDIYDSGNSSWRY